MTSDQLTAREKVVLKQFRKARLQQTLKHRLYVAPKYAKSAVSTKAPQVE